MTMNINKKLLWPIYQNQPRLKVNPPPDRPRTFFAHLITKRSKVIVTDREFFVILFIIEN